MADARPRALFSLRRLSRTLLWTALAIVAAGLLLPLIHANRFHRQIRTALESALGRRVEIGGVTLNLFTGPGFQLQNVIIGDDPAFGAEHFAYMDSMQVRLRLRTLWTGQIQVASLTLIDPSINLVKNAQGRWNFETLLARSASGGAPGRRGSGREAPVYFPYIGIQDGRVNFKFGDYKSVFHFQDVEAAFSPMRDAQGRWRVRFAGLPARTDRILSGMGRFLGEGELGAARRLVSLDLALETSPMEHLFTLFSGRDFGLHGEFGAKARLSGEASAIRVEGVLEAGDVHRWDLLPSRESRFPIPFVGQLSLPRQRLELATAAAGPAPAAVRGSLVIANYLNLPEWKASVELDGAPADPFVRTARHLGAALPAAMEVRGRLVGRLDFAGTLWPQGAVSLEQGQILMPASPPIAVGTARSEIDGPDFELSPVDVKLGKEALQVSASGRLQPFALEAQVAARGVPLEELRRQAPALQPVWLTALSAGFWDGRMTYHKEAGKPGVWTGSGTLSKARWQPQGLESPIDVTQARVRWEPGFLFLEGLSGALGETKFAGSCQRRFATATTLAAAAPTDTRLTDTRPPDTRSPGIRPGATASANAASANTASANTASASTASANTASAKTASANAASANTASANTASANAASANTASANTASANTASAGTASAGTASANTASAGATRPGTTWASSTPAGITGVATTRAGATPAGAPPAATAPAGTTPAAAAPAGTTPAAAAPAGTAPAGTTPADHEDSCKLRVADLDLAQLDRWVNPQQKRSRWDIWRRALGRTTPETPAWLKSARIQGAITVGNLRLGGWVFRNVRSQLAWNGESLVLDGLRAELGKGTVSGVLRAEFAGLEARPQYRLDAAVRGADLKSLAGSAALPPNFQRGTMDLALSLTTAGRTAEELRTALQASGGFQGRSITLDNVEWNDAAGESDSTVEIRALEGRFELAQGTLDLTGVRMTVGKEIYLGRGSIGGRPGVLLEVASTHGKQSRLVGSVAEEVSAPVP